MKNTSMKKIKSRKQSDYFDTKFKCLKLPFDFLGSRRIKSIRAILIGPQNDQFNLVSYSTLAQRKESSPFTLVKNRFFTAKPFFSLFHKDEQKKKIDRFANLIMCASPTKGAKKSGKKTLAYKLLLNSFFQYRHQIYILPKKKQKFFDPHLLMKNKNYKAIISISKQEFEKIILNLQFVVETRKVRIGGSLYQVPSIINQFRQEGLAMRSLISDTILNKRTGVQSFDSSLSSELIAVRNRESSSRQTRDKIYSNALSNRAYARYRWW